MSKIPKFLKRDGLSLIFKDEGELIFFIPEVYFERDYVGIDGDKLSLIGIFNYGLFDKNGKPIGKLKTFNYPTMITCIPSDIEKLKGVRLDKNCYPDDFRALKFKKDDVVILSTKSVMSVDNVELFLKMFNSGKIPNTIPDDKLHELYIRNAELNNIKYPISYQVIGMITSTLIRNRNDMSKPYRLNRNGGYVFTSIKNIPKLVSSFTAFNSENWDESIVYAINNDSDKESPLERLIFH